MTSEIKDGVYGYVSGTVGRKFTTKSGEAFEIEVTAPNSKYPDKWTVWGDMDVARGDRVTVKGWLSAKAETFQAQSGETKAACRRAVNKPEKVAHEAPELIGGGSYGDDTGLPF